MSRSYSGLLSYGVAIGLTAIALLLKLSLDSLLSETLGGFFYIAILISTWYGGSRPGIVTVVLSAVAIEYFFLYPRYKFWVHEPKSLLQLSIFLVVAFVINRLTNSFLNSKQKIQQLNRKLAQENAEQLRMALTAAHMGMWDWDIITGEIKWSPEHEELFGMAVGSFDGRYQTFEARIHPEDRLAVNQALQQALQTHSIYQHEYRIIWADGSIHWLEARGQAFYNPVGEPVHMIGTIMAIDQRKQAQEALRQSEERYRTLFESIDEGFCVIEMLFDENQKPFDYRFLEINPTFEKQTGLKQALGKTARQLVPNLEEFWFEIYGQVALTGESIRFEHDSVPMQRWFDVYALRVQEPSSRKVALVFQDITKRKQAEIALQQLNAELEQRVAERTAQLAQANDRLTATVIEQHQTQLILLEQAQLLDLAHDTILTRDLNGTITFWNQGAEKMYGWTKAEALGEIVHTLLKTQFPQPLTEIEAELLKNNYWEGELIHFSRDAQPINVASRWVLQTDNTGNPIKILEINNDITERKQAEATLQEYLNEVEDLYNNAPCGYHSLDAEGNLLRINDTELKWLGYTRDEMLHKNFADILTCEGKQVFQENFPKFKKQGWITNLEFEVVNKDGTTRWISLNATGIKDVAGNFVMSRSTLFDISDRKLIEDALRQSEEKFRQLAENIQAVFWITDIQNQQILYVSKAYETIWQSSCESLYQNFSNWLEPIHPEDRHRADSAFMEQLKIGQSDIKYRIIRPDGTMRWIRDRAFPIKNEAGEIIRVAGIAEDITELQKVEQIKSEFISIVSHELRTPLTSIRAAMGLLKSGIYDQKPEKSKRMIEIAAMESERLVRLVNDILDLERLESGRAVLEKTNCQAADLIEQAVAGVKAIAKQENITFNIHSTDVKVWAAADAIIQTLTNLLGNAIKFSPPDSNITVSVQQQTDHVLFQISDQGRGIPAEKLELIFGRFQQVDASDSRDQGGTGLGLAICRSIIDQHGGRIWVESTLGLGSTFFFTLPLVRGDEGDRGE